MVTRKVFEGFLNHAKPVLPVQGEIFFRAEPKENGLSWEQKETVRLKRKIRKELQAIENTIGLLDNVGLVNVLDRLRDIL